jgi:hypothetical protein
LLASLSELTPAVFIVIHHKALKEIQEPLPCILLQLFCVAGLLHRQSICLHCKNAFFFSKPQIAIFSSSTWDRRAFCNCRCKERGRETQFAARGLSGEKIKWLSSKSLGPASHQMLRLLSIAASKQNSTAAKILRRQDRTTIPSDSARRRRECQTG